MLLYTRKIIKGLRLGALSISGKNYKCVTVYHRGGAHKRRFLYVDYFCFLWNVPAIVVQYVYMYKAPLMLLSYFNGVLSHKLLVEGVLIGDKVINKSNINLGLACSTYLSYIKAGVFVHNIELYKNLGAQYVRSIGMFAKLVSHNIDGNVVLKIKDKVCAFLIKPFAIATIGKIYAIQRFKKLKAGDIRHVGRRPVTKGESMNPVDHPHGGRTRGGFSYTPWGLLTKGKKTRRQNKLSAFKVKG